ncbi:peptide chain release factor 1 [Candidatus Sneabacter namystus]|uniref:Peptide chain release factor 1 n=1 Tax=Candidatus Sneabacter namystus TaxID=2601646 RepID=A0A5C0UJ95_9RICK|nr:peptide chain release factor 1 [Candidatus Sneabacter namystus]QEK39830.1 peptide chain release factor 1 [Candidatus Sneabacter namystus]
MQKEKFLSRIGQVRDKYCSLNESLMSIKDIGSSHYVEVTKEIASLQELVKVIEEYFSVHKEVEQVSEILKGETDKELLEYAQSEITSLSQRMTVLEESIKLKLLPKDSLDEKNAILEIRSGTGGDEAALFATELFGMYQKYAAFKGWNVEILSMHETDIGGCKEVCALITGKDAFFQLKFESGVHRVQRVPATESKGRVHTSAVTVAVLPEMEDLDVTIDDKDVKLETCRASGAGGQHVNTTDSAVRITHIPTGICVVQQDERSQHRNKAKALTILRSRVFEVEKNKRDKECADSRKSQVGSGDRSEKIRTYNFPQNRVTDHRIQLTCHNINAIVYEGMLGEILEALVLDYQAKLLQGL